MADITRRGFIARSFQGAAGVAAVVSVLKSGQSARADTANDTVVLALIGAGGRGRLLMQHMAGLEKVEFKYVCDVEDTRGTAAASEVQKIQEKPCKYVTEMKEVFDDKDVDGVVVATPEHWHALATVWACQAGKDVFVEKNISSTIWEGRKMVEAAKKYGRVVTAGFQCRSAPYVFAARDYIAQGGLGTVLYAKVFGMLPFVYGGYPKKAVPDSDPPAGLDWDKWLGPAAERSYNKVLHRQWYGFWGFSGGNASDAIHTLDVARLVLGDPPHPKAVHCVGGRWQHDDGGDMPDVEIITYEFDKMAMTFENTGFTPYMFKTPGDIRFADKFPYWPQNSSRIELYGTKAMMYLGRHGGGWQVLVGGGKELSSGGGKVIAEKYGMFPDKFHMPNWIDCIHTRKQPNGDVAVCHYSACLEHLGNLAYRTGNQRLAFDGRSERFTNNDQANKYLVPEYRKHYRMPEVI